MLSANVTSTPRPRPPAKARRGPSLPLHPPPPYEPRKDSILGSPIPVTAQLLDIKTPNELQLPKTTHEVEEWMNEKSREELTDLLVAAEDIIKSRETELGLTSVLCKNLYEENVSLKSKHDALLARIPGREQEEDREMSPLGSPTRELSPLPSPHPFATSLPRTPPRHARQISVTAGEIATLADQNAELLVKLERLEEESAHADLAGKRKLRKLEGEIRGLREELEKTREAGKELEEKANRVLKLSEDNVLKRKEREERIRVLKAQSRPSSMIQADNFEGVRDFAPASGLSISRSATPRIGSSPATTTAPALNLSTKPIVSPSIPEEPEPDQTSPYFSQPPTAQPLEYAIISQLLAKIRELEETNAQISDEQRATAERLASAQRDSESIRRAYEYLGDEGGQVQIVTDDAPSPLHQKVRSSSGVTIRFGSLRRTIDGDVSQLATSENSAVEFADGIKLQSTTRSTTTPLLGTTGSASSQKGRKSVMGLFDADSSPEKSPCINKGKDRARYPPTLTVSPAFRMLSPMSTSGDTSIWSDAATDGFEGSPSVSPPPFSPLSPSPSPAPALLTAANLVPLSGGQTHTLGSELGSEFGDDWGVSSGNHHLRASSLYDLTGGSSVGSRDDDGEGDGDGSVYESPPASPAHPEKPELVLPDSPSRSDSVWEDVEERPKASPSSSVTGGMTPTKSRFGPLHLVVNPPTPGSASSYKSRSPASASVRTPVPSSLREARSARNIRLSQTVKARTNRWVERRYAESPPLAMHVVRRRRSTAQMTQPPTMGRRKPSAMDETFETVMHQFSRSLSGPQLDFSREGNEDTDVDDNETDVDDSQALRLKEADSSTVSLAEPMPVYRKKPGFIGMMLEVWLWLQFAIVVMVFLWAMAKRGPKSVLEDAERRRAAVKR